MGRASDPYGERLVSFFENWSEDSAYLLGLTWADGSITQRKNGRLGVTWWKKEGDEDLLRAIKALLVLPQNLYLSKKGSHIGYQLTVWSHALGEFLVSERGILPRKSFVDPEYPLVSDKWFYAFARGYFDGDGCVTRSAKDVWYVKFCGSERFLIGLQRQLCRLVELPELKVHPGDGCFSLVWGAKSDVERVYDFLYPTAGLCLGRKYSIFSTAVGR